MRKIILVHRIAQLYRKQNTMNKFPHQNNFSQMNLLITIHKINTIFNNRQILKMEKFRCNKIILNL